MSDAGSAPDGERLISCLFGEETDLGDDFLAALLSGTDTAPPPTTDEEIEALMREQWGLPTINAAAEIARIESGTSIRPDDRDADDFSDEEWCVVRTMRKFCLDAISVGTPPKRRQKAVEWVFAHGVQEPRYGIEFHLACDMLRTRPWVIHALTQHLWFLRGIQIGALPLMADPLPDALQSEAILRAWNEGLLIVDSLWRRPGLPVSGLRMLVQDVDDAAYDRALERLIESGLVGLNNGLAYVTSRPATFRRQRGNVSWSRSFVGE